MILRAVVSTKLRAPGAAGSQSPRYRAARHEKSRRKRRDGPQRRLHTGGGPELRDEPARRRNDQRDGNTGGFGGYHSLHMILRAVVSTKGSAPEPRGGPRLSPSERGGDERAAEQVPGRSVGRPLRAFQDHEEVRRRCRPQDARVPSGGRTAGLSGPLSSRGGRWNGPHSIRRWDRSRWCWASGAAS